MSDPTLLDKTFHIIMKRMVETGQAPFYTEIAEELSLSVKTISTYRARIMYKLNMSTNAELILYAIRNKLVL